MSYTVLAVKWRPKRFDELVGQPHVVQALINSLAMERLHHAYLFSGTRGVGKTTVARILAKALNCAEGIVSEPCGQCAACVAIDAGRFVDLIEVDAASRTRVDDTRELLDNVQYAPTHGRYKVYLIDEVHMLSNHSFNALLKTLEEPPPHVKFLLATTDPQKLPVTVLSRCLQFHLKKLPTAQIVAQLAKICAAEEVAADDEGLRAMARVADGSMRDALSLLDQAIAFGGGRVEAAQVAAMLGTIDRNHVFKILTALADQDGAGLIAEAERLAELAPDFGALLDELMGSLQQIAVIQLVGGKAVDEHGEALEPFATRLAPEDVQLYYQIALHGRRDLAYTRDSRMGFEMTLLRMLAFRPAGAGGEAAEQERRPAGAPAVARSHAPSKTALRAAGATTGPDATARAAASGTDRGEPLPDSAEVADDSPPRADALAVRDWGGLLTASGIRGPARQLGDHCVLVRSTERRLDLVLKPGNEHLNTERVKARLESGLSEHLGLPLRVNIAIGEPNEPTPADQRVANENQRMRRARESIEQDPTVRAVQSAFGGVVEADTIQPIDDQ